MPDGAAALDHRTSLTRREFTLEAALAILSGCVITISDMACGSTVAPTSIAPPADVNGNIAANHGHIAVITGAQISVGTAIVALDIHGTAGHTHTLSISQADLTSLKNKQPITTVSTTDSGHSHGVTFTPV